MAFRFRNERNSPLGCHNRICKSDSIVLPVCNESADKFLRLQVCAIRTLETGSEKIKLIVVNMFTYSSYLFTLKNEINIQHSVAGHQIQQLKTKRFRTSQGKDYLHDKVADRVAWTSPKMAAIQRHQAMRPFAKKEIRWFESRSVLLKLGFTAICFSWFAIIFTSTTAGASSTSRNTGLAACLI